MFFIEKIKGIFTKKQSYSSDRYHERISIIEDFLSNFPIQFTLGHVIECVTNKDSILSLNRDMNINAIKALKHSGSPGDSKNIEALQADMYYPLLRGITDAPTQGDPVLLCEFAGRKYYLGPLNTINSPNFNPDVLMGLNKNKNFNEIYGKADLSLDILESLNINPHFKVSNTIRRLQKPITNTDYAIKDNASPFNRSVGDLMLEGRFGNSIRIGSRSSRPNIFISNGRNSNNRVETFGDGCLMTMTSFGSLKHHFSYPNLKVEQNFILSSNIDNKTNRRINFDNEYDKPQILLTSDRLIFNARSDKILLSSYYDVEIGTNRNFKVFTRNDTIIDSYNIYLGKPSDEQTGESYEMSPAVLGDELLLILQEMIDAIGKCNVGMTQPSGFTSTIDGTTVASGGSIGSGWGELKKIRRKLKRFLSGHIHLGIDRNFKK